MNKLKNMSGKTAAIIIAGFVLFVMPPVMWGTYLATKAIQDALAPTIVYRNPSPSPSASPTVRHRHHRHRNYNPVIPGVPSPAISTVPFLPPPSPSPKPPRPHHTHTHSPRPTTPPPTTPPPTPTPSLTPTPSPTPTVTPSPTKL